MIPTTTARPAVTTPAGYADNAWHHAVATFEPTGARIYVDGNLAAEDPTDDLDDADQCLPSLSLPLSCRSSMPPESGSSQLGYGDGDEAETSKANGSAGNRGTPSDAPVVAKAPSAHWPELQVEGQV